MPAPCPPTGRPARVKRVTYRTKCRGPRGGFILAETLVQNGTAGAGRMAPPACPRRIPAWLKLVQEHSSPVSLALAKRVGGPTLSRASRWRYRAPRVSLSSSEEALRLNGRDPVARNMLRTLPLLGCPDKTPQYEQASVVQGACTDNL